MPVAYGNDRYSADRKVLYLKGSGTVPEHRGKGCYTALGVHGLNEAKRRGAQMVTVQARNGTSEPSLKRLGFQSLGVYYHLVQSNMGDFLSLLL